MVTCMGKGTAVAIRENLVVIAFHMNKMMLKTSVVQNEPSINFSGLALPSDSAQPANAVANIEISQLNGHSNILFKT